MASKMAAKKETPKLFTTYVDSGKVFQNYPLFVSKLNAEKILDSRKKHFW